MAVMPVSFSHLAPALNSAVITGGAAGALTVTGIALGDKLILVQTVSATGANIASEFTITANTITNTGGTSTAGQSVLVVWYDASLR